jgi:acyl carrier protein
MTARTGDAADQLACTWLRRLVAGLLAVDEDEVATDQPLGELGIDSLTAAEFSVEIEERTGVNVPLEGFLGRHTLADVARELARRVPATDLDLVQ